MADWDGDGDPDLVVGNIEGAVELLRNQGVRDGLPVFSAGPQILPANRMLGGDAGPLVVDWDGDGTLDLLVGYDDGSVSFYRRTGKGVDYRLEPHELLGPSGGDPAGSEVSRSQGRPKLAACDWNGDGRLDLLVGDFYAEERPRVELDTEQSAEAARIKAESQKLSQGMERIRRQLEEQALFEFGIEKGADRNVWRDRDDFMHRWADLQREDADLARLHEANRRLISRSSELHGYRPSHGHVWVYLRKAEAAQARD